MGHDRVCPVRTSDPDGLCFRFDTGLAPVPMFVPLPPTPTADALRGLDLDPLTLASDLVGVCTEEGVDGPEPFNSCSMAHSLCCCTARRVTFSLLSLANSPI